MLLSSAKTANKQAISIEYVQLMPYYSISFLKFYFNLILKIMNISEYHCQCSQNVIM